MAGEVSISQRPRDNVKNLNSITRGDGLSFTVKWSNPSSFTDKGNRARPTWIDHYWSWKSVRKQSSLNGYKYSYAKGTSNANDRFDSYQYIKDKGWFFRDPYRYGENKSKVTKFPVAFGGKVQYRGYELETTSTFTLNRTHYYPKTSRVLTEVSLSLHIGNHKGSIRQGGPTYKLDPPWTPTISAIKLANDDNAVQATVTSKNVKTRFERYDVMTRILRQDNFKAFYKKSKPLKNWSASTAETVTLTQALTDHKQLLYNQWIRIQVQAYARGVAGDSKLATKTYILSHPSVKSVAGDKITVNGNKSTGYVHIPIYYSRFDQGRLKNHPVDSCELEVLTTTESLTASEAGSQQGWNSVEGAVGDSNCQGFTHLRSALDLYDNNGDALGKHVWYRVRTKHATYERVSDAVEAKKLFEPAPTATDDTCAILNVQDQNDGECVRIVVGMKASDDSDTTEVRWTDTYRNFKSTGGFSTFSADWVETGPARPVVSAFWPRTCTIFITGLEDGQKLYFSARRSNSEDGTHGKWTPTLSVTPHSQAKDVVLTAPEVLPKNGDLSLSWTFTSEKKQTKAVVYYRSTYYNSKTRKNEYRWNALATVTGTSEATSVPWKDLPLKKPDTLYLKVGVQTSYNGPIVMSPEVKTVIAVPPSCVIEPARTTFKRIDEMEVLRSQPAKLLFATPTLDPNIEITATLKANGCVQSRPSGVKVQPTGTVVWSSTWRPTAGKSKVPLFLPVSDLVDGARYTLVVTVTDLKTKLKSEPKRFAFRVGWVHQAVAPSAKSFALPTPGNQAYSAEVYVPMSDSAGAATDRLDLYRVTKDRVELIDSRKQSDGVIDPGRAGLPDGAYVVFSDKFAPFTSNRGVLSYRVARVTTDGDVAWRDIPYHDYGAGLRFDWFDELHRWRSLTLPYNVRVTEGFTKSFESHSHLDGSVTGAWTKGLVDRRATLSTDLIKLVQHSELHLGVSELAQHTGPVYVRTPNGSAYCANVNVTSYSYDYDSLVSTVQLEATEVDLDPAFTNTDVDLEALPFVTL